MKCRNLVAVLFICVLNIFCCNRTYAGAYLSPESMVYNKETGKIYIGHATAPGISVFDIQTSSITSTIPLPSPVHGMCIDNATGLIYAGCADDNSCIMVFDPTNGKIVRKISCGYHPSDLNITPDGALVFVSNQFSNDVSVIDTRTRQEIRRIDVLREPSSLAVSPDGKQVAVANLLPDMPATEPYISAKVSLLDRATLEVNRHVGLTNGSYSLKDVIYSPDGQYIYITHLVGRFNVLTSQIEKGWINTNALSIISAKTNEYYATVLLDDIYHGAANPHGLDISADGKALLVAISGTHELFVIDREKMHDAIENTKISAANRQYVIEHQESDKMIRLFDSPTAIEAPSTTFDALPDELGFLSSVRKRIQLSGNGPRKVLSINGKVYVTNFFSETLEIVYPDGEEQSSMAINLSDPPAHMSQERYGEQLFHDASQCFQQWQSCASCHPGEARVDGLNWDLMNDGFGNPKNTKSLLHSYFTPPAMVTGVRPDAKTATRAGFKHIQFHNVAEEDATAVDAYLQSLQPVPSPLLNHGKLSQGAKKGRQIFESASCIHCHSGPYFTNGQKYEIGKKGAYDKQNEWDTPTLIEVWRTGPYLHDGRYATLKEVFTVEQHGLKNQLSEEEIDQLLEYVSSL